MFKLNTFDSLQVAKDKRIDLNHSVIKVEIKEETTMQFGKRRFRRILAPPRTGEGELNQEKFLISCAQVEST